MMRSSKERGNNKNNYRESKIKREGLFELDLEQFKTTSNQSWYLKSKHLMLVICFSPMTSKNVSFLGAVRLI